MIEMVFEGFHEHCVVCASLGINSVMNCRLSLDVALLLNDTMAVSVFKGWLAGIWVRSSVRGHSRWSLASGLVPSNRKSE